MLLVVTLAIATVASALNPERAALIDKINKFPGVMWKARVLASYTLLG